MLVRLAAVVFAMMASSPALAQQPVPLAPPPEQPAPPVTVPPPVELPPPAPPAGRDFCGQSVSYRVADPASVPEAYRPFIGIWSDAAWTPDLCAALIVENIAADGTATITYAFGPIGSGNTKPGGILQGTGIVQDGELKFQNDDGSLFSFKPFYSDLSGQLTTPKGETYRAIFKKTF